MSEDGFTFTVGVEEQAVSVKDWDELIQWLETERAKWAWLQRGGETDQPLQWASNVQSQWDQVLTNIRSYQSQGHQLSYAANALDTLRSGQLVTSPTSEGVLILDIRQSAGDVAAAYAYAFMKGASVWQHLARPDALLGVVLTALPNLKDTAEIEARLKLERKSFRDNLKSGLALIKQQSTENREEFEHLIDRAQRVGLETLRKRKEEWQGQQSAWGTQALNAVTEINNVRDAYQVFMQLRAPVKYWKDKAGEHKTAAYWAAHRLAAYFLVMIAGLSLAFGKTGQFLLGYVPQAGQPAPTAVYVVVSGGLVVLSTIAFWIGRLLTKLYLSEHHLRTDAEERAVMTEAYLALISEGAASESERTIILTSLFRASADGIVKDEGPPDIGLQSLISKAVTPR